MSIKTVNVVGYAKSNEQFVVKTENFDIRIGKNQNQSELNAPSPIEYILAGLAGCIHAVGTLVAKELNINLKSLQVEISGDLNVDRFLGNPTPDRAGYQSIEVIIKPVADVSDETLQNWLDIVESRCPVSDNLLNPTPVKLQLVTALETVIVQ